MLLIPNYYFSISYIRYYIQIFLISWIITLNSYISNIFDPVTRKEFWTALSRMLFGLEDWSDVYYSTHLKKLKEVWIISNDNPELTELRWYVMTMLMRSATN